MAKTKIEWCDYTVNPVKGVCPVGCSYCYARALYHRFKWDPEIKYDRYLMPELIEGIQNPSRIFVGSTMELFGDWISPYWMENIFEIVRHYKKHTFIFLTKKPFNLVRWSPYPDNCWIGMSAENGTLIDAACAHMSVIDAPVKFISIEPLLDYDIKNAKNGRFHWQKNFHDINWIIIGQQTPVRKSTAPDKKWIDDIIQAADAVPIPVFLKDNLKEMYPGYPWLRQEYPKVPKFVQ